MGDRDLKLFVVTQDEPVYAPRYLEAIAAALGDRHRIVGVTALNPGIKGLVRQRLAMYGPVDFVRAGWKYAGAKFRRRSVRRAASDARASVVVSRSVNDAAYVAAVRSFRPDLLVSVAANQVFGPELLAAPGTAAVNLHSSLLPKYRGIDGLFWALTEGEDEVGVTVHEMTEQIDAGSILAQQAIPVASEHTLHDLYLDAIEVGARLLARVVDGYESGTLEPVALDPAAGSYHSWPTREAARRFRAQGRRFF